MDSVSLDNLSYAIVKRNVPGSQWKWTVTFYSPQGLAIDFRQSNVTNHIKDKLKSKGFRTRVEWSRIQDGHSVQLHF